MSLSFGRSSPSAAPARPGLRAAWQAPIAVALAVLSVVVLGARFELVGCLFLALVTPELCRVDLTEHRLPNVIVVPGIAAAALGVTLGGLASWRAPIGAALCGLAVAGFFALLSAAGGLGMGDVKLSFALALAGGGVSAMIAVGTVVVGFLTAGVVAVAAILTRGSGDRIAFGPYLLGGFWASVAALPFFA